MGAVYKGWQRSLDRFVAIKILPQGLIGGEVDFAARFKREAKAMAKLKHTGIIPVHDLPGWIRSDRAVDCVPVYRGGQDLDGDVWLVASAHRRQRRNPATRDDPRRHEWRGGQ